MLNWVDAIDGKKESDFHDVIWKRKIGRLEISYSHNDPKHFWGRFGAGWQWELGFAASRRCISLHLLVATLTFYLPAKEKAKSC